jgi:hypothetical protein
MTEPPTEITLLDSLLAVEVLDYAVRLASPAVASHSVRSFLFAKLYAAHQGVELGREVSVELLFCSTVLHDLGLTEHGNRAQRLEVDGADLAAEFLTEKGLPREDVDAVNPGSRRSVHCGSINGGPRKDRGSLNCYS